MKVLSILVAFISLNAFGQYVPFSEENHLSELEETENATVDGGNPSRPPIGDGDDPKVPIADYKFHLIAIALGIGFTAYKRKNRIINS